MHPSHPCTRRRRRLRGYARRVPVRVIAVMGAAALAAAGGAGGSPAGRTGLQGTIRYGSFYSAALHGQDDYAVYLPPGYGRSTTRYPVVYYLHGLPASATDYRAITPIAKAVEESGRSAIVVGVQGARDGDGDGEWRDWGPGRNWETATAVELVSVIDRRYRTIPTREGRIIVGISAGGYGATLIASHHPAVYSVIESWSGYFHATNPRGTTSLDLGSAAANHWADFSRQIPLLRKRFARWWHTTWFSFYVGSNDDLFLDENERIDRELIAYRVPHVYFKVYVGGHSWSLWRPHAVAWLTRGLVVAAQPRTGRG
jgi:enterochelin esterase-like enzyme